MKLYEYKAKEIFVKYGIPIPEGFVVSKPEDLQSLPFPAAIKSQVLTGGRGKAGAIKFAHSLEEARKITAELLQMSIGGHRVKYVLVERKLDIAKELYLSLIIDRSARMPLLMASGFGGIEIEAQPDEKLYRKHINPLVGLQPFILRELAFKLNMNKNEATQIQKIAKSLYELFRKEDAELAEINPLVITNDGKAIACDAKMTIDDSALYRHPEYRGLDEDLTPLEKKAKEKAITFIQLDGNIGVIANGAGLTMATLDCLTKEGGRGGVFLDLGGTDDPQKVKDAVKLMKEANPSVILLNIFGGITRCDSVAIGVREAIEEEKLNIPVIARIRGVHEKEAKEILKEAGLIPAATIEEAAKETVKRSG